MIARRHVSELTIYAALLLLAVTSCASDDREDASSMGLSQGNCSDCDGGRSIDPGVADARNASADASANGSEVPLPAPDASLGDDIGPSAVGDAAVDAPACFECGSGLTEAQSLACYCSYSGCVGLAQRAREGPWDVVTIGCGLTILWSPRVGAGDGSYFAYDSDTGELVSAARWSDNVSCLPATGQFYSAGMYIDPFRGHSYVCDDFIRCSVSDPPAGRDAASWPEPCDIDVGPPVDGG